MTDRMTEQEIEALCSWIDAGATSGLIGVDAALSAEKLQQALTAIRQLQQPWQGIESAPRDGTWVQIWDEARHPIETIDRSGFVRTARWVHSIGWDCADRRHATAWMPLPLPPAGAGC